MEYVATPTHTPTNPTPSTLTTHYLRTSAISNTETRPENLYARTYEDFQRHTAGHQLTVLRVNGDYRHLRFYTPGSSAFAFDVLTWPGYTAIVGHIADGFTFSRELDFFHVTDDYCLNYYSDDSPLLCIDHWAQKRAREQRIDTRGRDPKRRYNDTLFLNYVRNVLAEVSAEDPAEFHEEVIAAAEDVSYDEHSALDWIFNSEYAYIFDTDPSTEFFYQWDHHFVLTCYALEFAARTYFEQTLTS